MVAKPECMQEFVVEAAIDRFRTRDAHLDFGTHDPARGGHDTGVTRNVLAIDEKHPGKLDISDLFDYPTLREIAAFMKDKA